MKNFKNKQTLISVSHVWFTELLSLQLPEVDWLEFTYEGTEHEIVNKEPNEFLLNAKK